MAAGYDMSSLDALLNPQTAPVSSKKVLALSKNDGGHLAKRLMVAAIDFGTTYSGYAFSFKHTYEKDPTRISMNKSWVSGANSLTSEKTPTTILLKPDQSFEAFGFDAENKFAELCETEAHKDWYYLKHFKMALYDNPSLDRETEVEAIDGKKVEAMKVFGYAIGYLKDHLLDLARRRNAELMEGDIYWVITVPAIWDDSAKQFMREAANLAGISSEQLTLTLEPEAASVYCKQLPVVREERDEVLMKAFEIGSSYMIIDAGGGTVDVTVHQVLPDGTLKQLYRASGGSYGGQMVDKNFIKLIKEIFGEDVWQKFIDKKPSEFLDLLRNFEHVKRGVVPGSDKKISFLIPHGLREEYREHHEKDIECAITDYVDGDKCGWAGDKLRIHSSLILPLFEPVVEQILEHLEGMLEDHNVQTVTHVFLVGGFALCRMLHEEMQSAFSNLNIVVPEDAQLCVLKGAVLFGYRPNTVAIRKSAYTYGINVRRAFLRDHDPDDKKSYIDGQPMCETVFSTYLLKDQEVGVEEVVHTGTVQVLRASDTYMTLPVFRSTNKEVNYIDEPGCEHLGTLRVNMPDTTGGKDREALVKMVAGGTEFTLEAVDINTNRTYEATFDFLVK